MTQSYFDIIPIDLLNIIVPELKINTVLRLMATNKYLHNVEITYHKYLICLNTKNIYYENPLKLKWYTDPKCADNESPNTKICTKVNKWSQYSYICKYQCMAYKNLLTDHVIDGFCTDMPIDILQSSDFLCRCLHNNFINAHIDVSKIIDHGYFKQVKITEKNLCSYFSIQYQYQCQSIYRNFNIHYSSEIIFGRLPLYADNNIKVSHTTVDNIIINKTEYLISFYTLVPGNNDI